MTEFIRAQHMIIMKLNGVEADCVLLSVAKKSIILLNFEIIQAKCLDYKVYEVYFKITFKIHMPLYSQRSHQSPDTGCHR